jgi:hypothetical protein
VTRLVYSPRGFLRSLEVSRAHLHVFVEGRDLDPYIYGRLCENVCGGAFGYRLQRADELPGAGGGGKAILLDLFRRLRRAHRLKHTFKGQTSVIVFFPGQGCR